jgi:hypothetical protein
MNKKERMNAAILKHGKNLNAIFPTGLEPVALCKKLKRLENQASELTLALANGDRDDVSAELDAILSKVKNLLHDKKSDYNIPLFDAIFINQDPRGYALKIDDAMVRELRDRDLPIYQDWGGYGILAPDFSNE